MNTWQPLKKEAQLEEIKEASYQKPQLIFKHSVTCGISAQANHTLEASTEELAEKFDLHYLDLLSFRSVSNKVADEFEVRHQSPQVLLVKEGKVIYHTSHFSIQPAKILANS